MNETLRVFVIVVTHNGAETIYDCLKSVEDSKFPLQTVVVENASTDDTPNIINQFQNIIFLAQAVNLGFGQANNIGMKYAMEQGADYVFLLNQDAKIKDDTIQILINCAKQNPEYGILSPLHLNGDGSDIDEKVVDYLIRQKQSCLTDLYFGQVKECYDVDFINAAAWLMSRDCIQTVGGFDDLFFMYGEDDDYCVRVSNFGFKIGVVPKSVMYHKRTGKRQGISNWETVKKQAGYQSALIKARFKKSNKSFLLTFLLWRIDHLSKKLELLVKGHFGDLIIMMLAGSDVLLNLFRIYSHKKQGLQKRAFWG